MNLEQQPSNEFIPPRDAFAEKRAARHREEERVRRMMAMDFRRGDILRIDGEEWQLWDTFADESGEGVKFYKMDPATKKVSGEKKISFEDLQALKELKEAA